MNRSSIECKIIRKIDSYNTILSELGTSNRISIAAVKSMEEG